MDIHDQTILQCIILFNKEHGQNQSLSGNKWPHSEAAYTYLCQVLQNKDTNFTYSDDSRSIAYHIKGNCRTIFYNHNQACQYIVYDTEIDVLNLIYKEIKKTADSNKLERIEKLESLIRPKLDSWEEKSDDLDLMRLLVQYAMSDNLNDYEEFEMKVLKIIKKRKVNDTISLALNMCVIS